MLAVVYVLSLVFMFVTHRTVLRLRQRSDE